MFAKEILLETIFEVIFTGDYYSDARLPRQIGGNCGF